MKRDLNVAHLAGELPGEDHLGRFVITLRGSEPLHRMLDQMVLKILKALPLEIPRPTSLRFAELLGVELL